MRAALVFAGRRLATFLVAGIGLAGVWLFLLWLRSL